MSRVQDQYSNLLLEYLRVFLPSFPFLLFSFLLSIFLKKKELVKILLILLKLYYTPLETVT